MGGRSASVNIDLNPLRNSGLPGATANEAMLKEQGEIREELVKTSCRDELPELFKIPFLKKDKSSSGNR